LQEYADWYLNRDGRKGGSDPIPDKPEEQVRLMWQCHPGKMRDWFNAAATRWHIVELDAAEGLENLVFLESPWTKAAGLVIPDGPNYRLLKRVVENAIATKYLARASDHRHKKYYERLMTGDLKLAGEDRIAICSAEDSEIRSNPAARYYLLDGVGRGLPYGILFMEGKLRYAPIEAFLARR
jgi:hypothetical protein